mgnify:FL=1
MKYEDLKTSYVIVQHMSKPVENITYSYLKTSYVIVQHPRLCCTN